MSHPVQSSTATVEGLSGIVMMTNVWWSEDDAGIHVYSLGGTALLTSQFCQVLKYKGNCLHCFCSNSDRTSA